MIRSSIVAAALACLAIAAGCSKASNDQAKADKAQAEANDKTSSAQSEAEKKANQAQADADKKIAAARADFLKIREDYRHKTAANLVDLDQKISDLDAKAKTATGKTKASLDASLKRIHAQRDAFALDAKSIEAASATTWDDTKARLDKEWNDLKGLVDSAGNA